MTESDVTSSIHPSSVPGRLGAERLEKDPVTGMLCSCTSLVREPCAANKVVSSCEREQKKRTSNFFSDQKENYSPCFFSKQKSVFVLHDFFK